MFVLTEQRRRSFPIGEKNIATYVHRFGLVLEVEYPVHFVLRIDRNWLLNCFLQSVDDFRSRDVEKRGDEWVPQMVDSRSDHGQVDY